MGGGDQQVEFAALLRAVWDHLEVERGRGSRWLPRSSRVNAALPAGDAAEAPPPAPARTAVAAPRAAVASPAARPPSRAAGNAPAPVAAPAVVAGEPAITGAAHLGELVTVLGDCRRCRLAAGRTHIVFGVGNEQAALMFVGEGPGRDEDLQGEPFVGRAGQLLTEIIVKGMKLRREDVYIANVVKCRPPQNRNPEPDEIASCMPFLMRQIDIVRPRVIVALGKFAAHTLLETTTPITRLRGQWHEFRGIKLMPTLHPAYLLRNPADKRLVWEDIKMVMTELGLAP